MLNARADFPLATSPPNTTRSWRRTPPPSIRSSEGKPVATVSGEAVSRDRASIRLTRLSNSESVERVGRLGGRGIVGYTAQDCMGIAGSAQRGAGFLGGAGYGIAGFATSRLPSRGHQLTQDLR